MNPIDATGNLAYLDSRGPRPPCTRFLAAITRSPSTAEAVGHLDRPKLEALRTEMERDLEGTLKKHPGVADLAGYIRFGGPEFDELRQVLGVQPGGPHPPVDPKWQNSCPITGRAIVRHTIDLMSEVVLDFERELFGLR